MSSCGCQNWIYFKFWPYNSDISAAPYDIFDFGFQKETFCGYNPQGTQAEVVPTHMGPKQEWCNPQGFQAGVIQPTGDPSRSGTTHKGPKQEWYNPQGIQAGVIQPTRDPSRSDITHKGSKQEWYNPQGFQAGVIQPTSDSSKSSRTHKGFRMMFKKKIFWGWSFAKKGFAA